MENFETLQSGSVAISNAVALEVEDESWAAFEPGGFALKLLCLDAFIHALLLSEKVYVITPYSMDVFLNRHADLPIETIFPGTFDDPNFPRDELVGLLLSDSAYSSIVSKENQEALDFLKSVEQAIVPDSELSKLVRGGDFVKKLVETNALITVGDLWRARKLGLPFFASQLETPICIYDQLALSHSSSGMVKSVSQTGVNLVKEIWYAKAYEANKLKGFGFFTLRMPLFLLTVLRECKFPEDIWTIASQMREVREVRALRDCFTDMDSETNLAKFIGRFSDMERLANDLVRIEKKQESQTTIQLGIPPSVTLPVPSPGRLWDSVRRPGRQLRFLKRLFRNAIEVGRLEDELVRVFNVGIEQARKTTELIDATGTGVKVK